MTVIWSAKVVNPREEFVNRYVFEGGENPTVTDERFKFTTQRLALEPVDAVPTP